MSPPIHVEAYSGHKASERPLSFSVDIATGENGVTGVYDIDAVEDRWYEPDAEYFKVRTVEGNRYIEQKLRYMLNSAIYQANLSLLANGELRVTRLARERQDLWYSVT